MENSFSNVYVLTLYVFLGLISQMLITHTSHKETSFPRVLFYMRSYV